MCSQLVEGSEESMSLDHHLYDWHQQALWHTQDTVLDQMEWYRWTHSAPRRTGRTKPLLRLSLAERTFSVLKSACSSTLKCFSGPSTVPSCTPGHRAQGRKNRKCQDTSALTGAQLRSSWSEFWRAAIKKAAFPLSHNSFSPDYS